MAGADEREPPLHKGVIFLEVSKEGYYRVSGYTGSKDAGDQDQILNANGQNPARIANAAKGIVDEILNELVIVLEKNPPAPKQARSADGSPDNKRGRGRTK